MPAGARVNGLAAALTALGLAVGVWPAAPRGSVAAHRVRRMGGQVAGGSRSPRRRAPDAPRVVAGLVAFATMVVIGSAIGVGAGLVLGAVTDRLLRARTSGPDRRRQAAREAALPPTLDLLAVALRAGLPFGAAAEAVAAARAGPLAGDLARVASLIRLGAAPLTAWADYAADPVWGVVTRAVTRSAESGSALAAALERVAEDRRTATDLRGEGDARRASVFAMAPLGLCFLPAFVCLGVVPVVIGMASGALR